jgi:hypothetical protein
MRKYIVGFAVGVALGAAVPASAAVIVGSMGYLWGWTVTVNGNEVCEDPYIWPTLREIECD